MIHTSAIVHPDARVDPSATVEAHAVIGPHVIIGPNTRIGPHAVIEGRTRIGADNNIHGFSAIGGPPQDKKYRGEPTSLEIGDRNTIREFCTFNCGTVQDSGVTRLGNDNWIMAYVHLAHDCQVGSNTIFANNAQIAGHVRVGDYAILGAFTAVHQFVSIGAHSLTALGTILLQDLPPFVTASGNTAEPHGINSEGLKRRGFTPESIAALRSAYKTLYKSGLSLDQARQALARQAESVPEVGLLVEFLGRMRRGLVR